MTTGERRNGEKRKMRLKAVSHMNLKEWLILKLVSFYVFV